MAPILWNNPTMAELYVTQGHIAHAICIYKICVENAPDNDALKERLIQLTQQLATKGNQMGFSELLEEYSQETPGVLGICISGMDGLSIACHQLDGLSVDVADLSAEFSILFKQAREIPSLSGEDATKNVTELCVRYEELRALLMTIDENFFVLLILTPDAILGRAIHGVKILLPQLKTLLSA